MSTPDPYLRGHGDLRYRVTHYDLDLTYRVGPNHLDETAVLHVRLVEDTATIDIDLRGLQAKDVRVDGKRVTARRLIHGLRVPLGERAAGDELTVTIQVTGKPGPVRGVHGAAGWEELTDGSMVGAQPHGAPGWFPCNDDAADKATYRISVATDPGYHVVANGTLVQKAKAGRLTRWTYAMDRPMSPYLATVQIGHYVEKRVTRFSTEVPVSIVHPRGVGVGPGTSFAHQGTMVDVFSELFGPYPFAEYRAVITGDPLEIPLEAQGLSTFGRNFVPPAWQNERLVAHELAHQWFGNAVTGAHLQDIWLHEGFACYAEWLWSDHCLRHAIGATTATRTVQQLAAVHHTKLVLPPLGHTLADPGMRAMFDDWVYKRGALALHAVRAELGDEAFFPLLRAWVAEHAGATATTADFQAHCRAHAGARAAKVAAVLYPWLHEREIPRLPVLG